MPLEFFFFFQAEDGIRDVAVTGVQTCALPICSRHALHTLRPRRWARISRSEDETRNGGIPMSRSRATVEGQSFVWSVVKTRGPVSAARIEICAVSRSRVSPTRITSGAWRRDERSAAAKGRPTLSLICTWLTPLRLYSTGSSAVMMLTSGELIVWIAE